MKLIAIILIALITTANATIYHSDGSASNTQALHDAAQPGDSIVMPAGTFTWAQGVSFNKKIRFGGLGSGRIIGDSLSSVTIGTGNKTFITGKPIAGITVGQTLRVAKQPSLITHQGRENYMEGTVVSYTGQTLVLNVTSTGGSGTHQWWWIATQPKTTIITDAPLSISETAGSPIEVLGIKFVTRGTNPNLPQNSLIISSSAYITPKALIHDNWFQAEGIWPSILALTNQALIWNCSFDDKFSQQSVGIQVKAESDTFLQSWRSNSTIGNADTLGKTNLYVEDCDFHGYLNCADWDSNGRVVFRHNLMDNVGMTSHGADTGGPWGMRHVELYDNEMLFYNFGDCDGSITAALTWFYWHRGGTAVITDNILPNIFSCAWQQKANIAFSVLNIDRNAGCFACWPNGYPAPHQVGQGFGAGAVFHTWNCSTYTDDADYYTYLEPVYIWNNTGTGGNNTSLNEESDACGSNGNQQLSDYVMLNRDYIKAPKPGYVKYLYPHQKRAGHLSHIFEPVHIWHYTGK